jgi:hypothetical protein
VLPGSLYYNSCFRRELEQYRRYQARCNSFFMDVVSQLCFAEDTAPSPPVVDKLMGLVTRQRSSRAGTKTLLQTKEMTIFDDGIDPTPVVRSFLLQLLMRTSGDKVDEYLQRYLQDARRLFDEAGAEQYLVQLCLLVVQCIEV